MVQRNDPSRVYEDATTTDPAALNAALTATRESDLVEQDAFAAYKLPDPVESLNTGVAENPQPDPGYLTNPQSNFGAHGGIAPSATPSGATPAGDPAETPKAEEPAPGDTPAEHEVPTGSQPTNEVDTTTETGPTKDA